MPCLHVTFQFLGVRLKSNEKIKYYIILIELKDKTSVNPDSVNAKVCLTRIKLKVQMISYILQFLIKSFELSLIKRFSPNLNDFVCQIESGLTEVYCMSNDKNTTYIFNMRDSHF